MAENQGGQVEPNGARRQNPADNLSHADRVRGGERSSKMQRRDGQGQFAGRRSGDEAPSSTGSSSLSNRGGGASDAEGSMDMRGSAEDGLQT